MFRRRSEALPAGSRRLLTLAAAEPTGDHVLFWRTAALLGISDSAAYQAASARDRKETHAALADAMDPAVDPDRRAWHRAQAADGPDEDVAGELERSADRAQTRGGLAAAAAFLERATMLTPGLVQRTRRALAAAEAKLAVGAVDASRDLLAIAEAGAVGEPERARAMLLRARLAFAQNRDSQVPALLLAAAERLEPVDADLARGTRLDAVRAVVYVGASPAAVLTWPLLPAPRRLHHSRHLARSTPCLRTWRPASSESECRSLNSSAPCGESGTPAQITTGTCGAGSLVPPGTGQLH